MTDEHVPRLLIVGVEPDRERRNLIRQAGADWALWEPLADREFRFFVDAARSNRNWKVPLQTVRVPLDTLGWIRAGAHRGAGILRSLSRRGTLIETSESYTVGQPIHVEFQLETRPISVFANVTRMHCPKAGGDESIDHPLGIDVIFYEVDDLTDGAIEEAVERLGSHYRP